MTRKKYDTNVDYESIVEKPGEQILVMMNSGELSIPPPGSPERAEFMDFVKMENDARLAFIEKKKGAASPGDKPDESGDKPDESGKPPAEPAPSDKKADGVGGEPPPPAPGEEPAEGEWGGYESKEKMLEAHTDLRASAEGLQGDLAKQRATNSRLGREVKEQKDQLSTVNTRLQELEDKNTPAPVEKPTRPTKPKADDFEEGIADPKYETAMQEYETGLDTYEEQREAYWEGKLSTAEANFDKRVSELGSRVDKADEFVSETRGSQAQTAQEKAWSGMWEKTASFQKQLGLPTSVAIEKINPHALVRAGKDKKTEDGQPQYSEQRIAEADQFWKTLPDKDKENFNKLVPVLNSFFDFGEGTPKAQYRTLAGCLSETGLVDKGYVIHTPAPPSQRERDEALAEKQRKSDGTAHSMPADQAGGSDKPLDGAQTWEEERTRLRELTEIRKEQPRRFRDNPELQKEFNTLRAKLAEKMRTGAA
jgi:hypothetical protein